MSLHRQLCSGCKTILMALLSSKSMAYRFDSLTGGTTRQIFKQLIPLKHAVTEGLWKHLATQLKIQTVFLTYHDGNHS